MLGASGNGEEREDFGLKDVGPSRFFVSVDSKEF
jgi:hypothetical protein